MANRRDFYFRQKVTEAELDGAFDEFESADRAIVADLGLIGIASGLGVAQQASPNLTVQVAGGVAYDQSGQRMSIPSTQNLNCALDEDGLNTAVVTPGNSRILSVFLEFDRVLSDPRVDGNSATVYFVRAESFVLNLAKGVEGVSPVAPVLRGDQILLADITLAHGATTIVTADIATTRRQTIFQTTGIAVSAGQPEEALQALITLLTNAGGLNLLGALTGTGEILYSGGRARSVMVPIVAAPQVGGTWAVDSSGAPLSVWEVNAATDILAVEILHALPHGATLTALDVFLSRSDDTGTDASIRLFYDTFNATTPALTGQTEVGSAVSVASGTGVIKLEKTGIGLAIDKTSATAAISRITLQVRGQQNGRTKLLAIRAHFTDPGPRNV
jgi:hypothetical protein